MIAMNKDEAIKLILETCYLRFDHFEKQDAIDAIAGNMGALGNTLCNFFSITRKDLIEAIEAR